ncbi:MAG: FG-GAP repeat domain-containing protein, partial [Phycisphaerales bacterium]
GFAALDGSGANGKSLVLNGGAAVIFDTKALGGLPRRFGFVVTDGGASGATVTVSVFTATGAFYSRVFGAESAANDANDDIFIGIELEEGIDSVSIAPSSPSIAIDHLQYETGASALLGYVRDDIDQDGKSDVVWSLESQGKGAGWIMDGYTRVSGGLLDTDPGIGRIGVGIGDLDGDRRADAIFRDPSTGVFTALFMNGLGVSQLSAIGEPVDAVWECVGIGDLNGDRKADLVFQRTDTGEARAWIMDGATKTDGGFIGNAAGLRCIGVGDLNADRRDDILWQDASGQVYGWTMNGRVLVEREAILNSSPVAAAWEAAGIGDTDGDSRADVIWQNSDTGRVSIWRMNGLRRVDGALIQPIVNPAWKVAATPDLNGDGKADLLWRHATTGDVNGWLMNGFTRTDGGFIAGSSTAWKIVN